MTEPEPTAYDLKVTCHTSGCPVEGQTFDVVAYKRPDGSDTFDVFCGRCVDENGFNNRITDIVVIGEHQ